jgi:hypothetical protein
MSENKKKDFLNKFINNLNTKDNKNFYNKIINTLENTNNNLNINKIENLDNIEDNIEDNINDTINNTINEEIKNITAKSSSIIINPLPNETIDIFIDNNLSYVKGNILKIESENLLNKFEATVDYYDSDIGLLKLSKIRNIIGVFHNYTIYNITLKLNNCDKYYPLYGIEKGIYYRGKGEIINDTAITIRLPDYLSNIAHEFTINITPIYKNENNNNNNESLFVSEIENNQFNVYGKNRKFFWTLFGKNI